MNENKDAIIYLESLLKTLKMEDDMISAKNKVILFKLPYGKEKYISKCFENIANIFKKYNKNILFDTEQIQESLEFHYEFEMSEDESSIIKHELAKLESCI